MIERHAKQLRSFDGQHRNGCQAGGADNQQYNSNSYQNKLAETLEKVRADHFPRGIAHLLDAALDVAADVIGRAAFAFHGPAILRRTGSRHANPEKGIDEGDGEGPYAIIDAGEEGDGSSHRKSYPEPGSFYAEILGQAAANAAKTLVAKVPEEFSADFAGLRRRFGVIGLNTLRSAYHIDDALDGGIIHHGPARRLILQQLCNAFFDAFHDFFPTFLFQVVVFQGSKVTRQGLGGILVQDEGVSAHTHLFRLFHGFYCFKVSILRTISSQAASISASCWRPLSVMT